MPNPPTTYMLLVLPTDHDDDNAWGDLLNKVGGVVDAHRHITGEGQKVPVAGMNFDTDVPIGHRITTVTGLAFTNLGSLLVAGARELFTFGDDLYFRNGAGTNVPVTIGNALAMTTAGGIAGNYTSVSAEIAYVDASDSYTAKQQVGAAVRQYAKWESADLHLYEYKAHPAAGVPTTFVGIRSPVALGASYSVTMPGAVPAGTKLTQVDNAGTMTWSNTIVDALTLSSALTANALITANAGLTAAVNQHITVSGTGRFKHSSLSRNVSPLIGNEINTTNAWSKLGGYILATGAAGWSVPLPLLEGERLQTYSFRCYGEAPNTADLTYSVISYSTSGVSTVLATNTINNIAAAWQTESAGAVSTVAAGAVIVIEFSANAAGIRIGNIQIGYDWP